MPRHKIKATYEELKAQEAEFRTAHPGFQHHSVPIDMSAHRVLGVWYELLEAQNGRDLDDGVVDQNTPKIVEYGNRFAPVEQYPRMLVLGAGCGREVAIAREAGWQVQGVTFGPMNVAFGKYAFDVDLTFADMHALPFAGEAFDVIEALQTFEHSFAPLHLVIECNRLLRPGGKIVIETPPSKLWTMGANRHHVTCPTARQLEGWLLKGGFTAIDLHQRGVGPITEAEMDRGDLTGDLVACASR